ncbi:MAG TPA: hypothetical protein VMV77_11075 [Bacteroidales bacterium]|nr:hypothetical protein [Bacteroidales bacterium]
MGEDADTVLKVYDLKSFTLILLNLPASKTSPIRVPPLTIRQGFLTFSGISKTRIVVSEDPCGVL